MKTLMLINALVFAFLLWNGWKKGKVRLNQEPGKASQPWLLYFFLPGVLIISALVFLITAEAFEKLLFVLQIGCSVALAVWLIQEVRAGLFAQK